MYSLEATDEYEEAFDKLTSQIPNLEQELQKGLYLVLARTPARAQGVYQSPLTSIWTSSQVAHAMPLGPTQSRRLFNVRLFYLIDEERKVVTLVDIRAGDIRRL